MRRLNRKRGSSLVRWIAPLLTLVSVLGGGAGAAAYDLEFIGGVNPSTGGTCTFTLNSRCRFNSVVVGAGTGPYQRDVVVTVSRLSNATLTTAFDNPAPVLSGTTPRATATQFFAPTVQPTQNTPNVTGWAEFTFDFIPRGGAVPAVGAGNAALPGALWVSTFDTDGDGGTLREFAEFLNPVAAGLSAGTTLSASAAVAGGTQYQGATAGQANISTGDAYKASAIYTDAASIRLIYGARTGASGSGTGGRLTAFDFFRPDAVLLRPIVDGYKSVKLTNDADGSGTVTVGDTLTYTLTYVNTGNTAVSGFQITDALPSNVTFVAGSQVVSAGTGSAAARNASYTGTGTSTGLLAAGASLGAESAVTVTIPVQVTAAAAGTTLSNQASASGTALAATPSDNIDDTVSLPPSVTTSAGWPGVPAGSLAQTEASTLDPTTAAVVNTPVDLAVSKTGPRYVSAGAAVEYTVTVTNAGPSTASGVTVRDAAVANYTAASVSCTASGGASCPAGLTLSSFQAGVALPALPSGGALTFKIQGQAANGRIVNVATLTLPSFLNDTSSSNNSAQATTDVLSVSLTKEVRNCGPLGTSCAAWGSVGSGKPGDVLEYRVSYVNQGSAEALSFVIRDAVPANTAADLSAYGAGLGLSWVSGGVITRLTSAAGDDAGSLSAGELVLTVGRLAPGAAGNVSFRANIR